MNEIPILFSTLMVQAELENRKTVTRRLRNLEAINENPGKWSFQEKFTHVGKYERDKHVYRFVDGEGSFMDILCPFGRPGDLLWVRETIYQNGELGLQYVADKEWIDEKIIPDDHKPYRNYAFCNIPSIHMQKYLARIWLQVESVRVERLQDISEKDAKAEGIIVTPEQAEANKTHRAVLKDKIPAGDYQLAFCNLWREIHFTSIQDQLAGKDGWNENPWVWVISFKVLSTTGKPDLNNL